MSLRTKQELLTLPVYLLSLREFSWCYPDRVCSEHYAAIKDALEQGIEVPTKYKKEYPSLTNVKRKRHAKRHEGGDGND